MLVLSRKKNQSIIVNDNIEVIVIELSHDQVKLGFRAPKDVGIHRSEIYERIKQEMQVAAKSHPEVFKPFPSHDKSGKSRKSGKIGKPHNSNKIDNGDNSDKNNTNPKPNALDSLGRTNRAASAQHRPSRTQDRLDPKNRPPSQPQG